MYSENRKTNRRPISRIRRGPALAYLCSGARGPLATWGTTHYCAALQPIAAVAAQDRVVAQRACSAAVTSPTREGQLHARTGGGFGEAPMAQ
jgi:hypothetical protein